MDLGRMTGIIKTYAIPIAGAAGLVVGLSGGYFLGKSLTGGDYGVSGVNTENSIIVDDQELEDTHCAEGGWVEIQGAVISPGVYCLELDTIVADAIAAAGGFSENACAAWIQRNINQASFVEANSKIYVPSDRDIECGGAAADNAGGNSSETKAVSAGMCPDGKVSINTASASQLETVSGIGPSTAQKIIEGRPYKSISDITNVSGIGDKTYEKLKNAICL